MERKKIEVDIEKDKLIDSEKDKLIKEYKEREEVVLDSPATMEVADTVRVLK